MRVPCLLMLDSLFNCCLLDSGYKKKHNKTNSPTKMVSNRTWTTHNQRVCMTLFDHAPSSDVHGSRPTHFVPLSALDQLPVSKTGCFPKWSSVGGGLHSSPARGWQAFIFNSRASLVFVKATFSSYWILIEGDSPQRCRYLATELCLIIHSIHIIVLIMMEMATPHVALMRRRKYADLRTGKFFFHFSMLCYIMISLKCLFNK